MKLTLAAATIVSLELHKSVCTAFTVNNGDAVFRRKLVGQLQASNDLVSAYQKKSAYASPAAIDIPSISVPDAVTSVAAPASDSAATATTSSSPTIDIDIDIEGITKAADQASQAANAAADAAREAANSFFSSDTATSVTKAVTSASTARAGPEAGKALTLWDYVTSPPGTPRVTAPSGNEIDNGSVVVENLQKLKNNLLGFGGDIGSNVDKVKRAKLDIPDVNVDMGSVKFPTIGNVDVKAVSGAVTGAVWNAERVVEAMKFKEFGAWYVAVIAVAAAFTQREAGKQEAKKAYQEQLQNAQQKADEAAQAAGVAAQSAAKAKKMAISGSSSVSASLKAEASLKASKLALMDVTQAFTAKQLGEMKDEVAKLQARLMSVENDKQALAEALAVREVVVNAAEEKIAEEAAAKAEAEAKAKAAAEAKASKEAEAKANAAAKKKATAEAKKKAAAEAKAKKEAEAKAKKEVAAAEAKTKKEAESNAAARKKAAAEAKSKKAAEAKAQAAAETKAKIEADAKAKTAAEEARLAVKRMEAEAKASKAKLAPKKKADTPKKAAPAKISDGGWASLSPSALKRKTVTEISEFLEQNGVTSTDRKTGKKMLKKDLIAAVEELLVTV